jgi:hypothetical protein
MNLTMKNSQVLEMKSKIKIMILKTTINQVKFWKILLWANMTTSLILILIVQIWKKKINWKKKKYLQKRLKLLMLI